MYEFLVRMKDGREEFFWAYGSGYSDLCRSIRRRNPAGQAQEIIESIDEVIMSYYID